MWVRDAGYHAPRAGQRTAAGKLYAQRAIRYACAMEHSALAAAPCMVLAARRYSYWYRRGGVRHPNPSSVDEPMPEFMTDKMRENISKTVLRDNHVEAIRKCLRRDLRRPATTNIKMVPGQQSRRPYTALCPVCLTPKRKRLASEDAMCQRSIDLLSIVATPAATTLITILT